MARTAIGWGWLLCKPRRIDGDRPAQVGSLTPAVALTTKAPNDGWGTNVSRLVDTGSVLLSSALMTPSRRIRRSETPELGHDPLTRRSGAVALTVILALVIVAFAVRGHQFLEQFYYPCPVAAIHIADHDQVLDNFSRQSLGGANCASAPARSIRHLSDHYGIVLEVVPRSGGRMPYVLITLEPNGNRFVIQPTNECPPVKTHLRHEALICGGCATT